MKSSKNRLQCRQFRRPAAWALTLGAASFLMAWGALGQTLYFESFDSLTLGPNIDEGLKAAAVWTKGPPTGWTADDSRMPGVGTPLDGVTEWSGWSFANKDWWVSTAEGQRREEFLFGTGTVMVADPDEWDDAAHAIGFWDATVSTPILPVASTEANSLVLAFDSSWLPEGFDDGGPDWPVGPGGEKINNQTGYITASFNGGAATEILRWDSITDNGTGNPGPYFHEGFPNESVLVSLNNPAALTGLKLTFGMEKAANDWWWAVDNVTVGFPPLMVGLPATGVGFTARLAEGLGKTVDESKPIMVLLDGATAAPIIKERDGGRLNLTFSQWPQVWTPKSVHIVKVTFTSNAGKAVEETRQFVAPSYTQVASTPVSVTATISDAGPEDARWLTVDETKPVTLKLDGVAVPTGSVQRVGGRVIVNYSQAPTIFAANSTHTLEVTFTTGGGVKVVDSVAFATPDWKTVPASLATAPGTGAQPGLRFRTYQIETNRPTTIAASEAQLRGELGPSVHDATGEVDGAFEVDVINFDQAAGNAGNFNSSAEAPQDVADTFIPGIGDGLPNNNITGDARAFVEFPSPGLYTMVVNSDDGFELSVGTTNLPTFLVLSAFDAGREAADSVGYFKIEQAGVYFIRLLWFEGDSSASVELFTVNADGTRALVNGTQNGALKAYRVRTVPEPVVTPRGEIQSFAYANGKLVLSYLGTLQSSATLDGVFNAVPGAVSPYEVTPGNGQKYYTAR